ncbi:MAG: hypothetical protein M3R08_08995 [Bacteroidota bacterium]|nr:hypothetical protein [Bacteroidota bacterium]
MIGKLDIRLKYFEPPFANQNDSFQLPDLQTALAMIQSNNDYFECN